MNAAEGGPRSEGDAPRENVWRSNPFSTRFVQPGAIPFVFPAGVDAARLVAQLRQADWWGEIVGPHGSGKSTLLAALAGPLIEAGREPQTITLHDGERSLSAHRATLAAVDSESLLIVDGFEQLWPWNRWRLRRYCRRRGCGLLVTAHSSTGLPRLFATSVDRSTAVAVLAALLPRGAPAPVGPDDLDRALAAHGQNLREALFDLYDLCEQRQAAKGN